MKCTLRIGGTLWQSSPQLQVRAQLSGVINRAAFAKERLFLTRRGKRIAAIVPSDDIDLLEALEDKIDIEEAADFSGGGKEERNGIVGETQKRLTIVGFRSE